MSCYQAGQTGAPGFVVIDLGLKNCPYTNNTNLLEPYCWLKFIYASGLTLYFVYMCELYGMCTQLGWLLLLWTLAFYREEFLRSVCTSLFILAGNDATFEDKTFKSFYVLTSFGTYCSQNGRQETIFNCISIML